MAPEKYVESMAVGGVWAVSLLGQSFAISQRPDNILWAGCFVALGEALVLFLQVSENTKDTRCFGVGQVPGTLLKSSLKACYCGALLYAVGLLGPLRSALLCCALMHLGDYVLAERRVHSVWFAALSVCSVLLLSWSSLLEESGNFLLVVTAASAVGLSLLGLKVCEPFYSTSCISWVKVFEHVIASVALAFCSWISCSSETAVVPTYHWLVFPLVSLASGFGKSVIDLRIGMTVPPARMIGLIAMLMATGAIGFGLHGVERGDVLIVLSGVATLVVTLGSAKHDFHLPSREESVYFKCSHERGSVILREALSYIASNRRERKLAVFLVLTGSVMVLELLYGISVNSLGLVSDSFHMMLDSTSIAIGLCAAYAASLPSDEKTHPFGYARYEVLGGFINAVLLLFIALYVVLESIERIISPPEIEATYLIHVSVVGLLVNVVGIVFFHEAHGHSHSHGECCGGGSVDHNLRGVYLHILADLLGSVSVIISSVVITITGAKVADPLCSVLSSGFIAMSAFPLLRETGKVLLLSNQPYDQPVFFEGAASRIKSITGVRSVESFFAWTHATAPRESTYCAIRLSLYPGTDHTQTRRSVKCLIRKILINSAGACHPHVIVHLE